MSYIKKTIEQMERDSIERSEFENLEVEQLDEETFVVYNLDKDTQYNVLLSINGQYECSCPHHTYRQINCKHIMKALKYYNSEVIA